VVILFFYCTFRFHQGHPKESANTINLVLFLFLRIQKKKQQRTLFFILKKDFNKQLLSRRRIQKKAHRVVFLCAEGKKKAHTAVFPSQPSYPMPKGAYKNHLFSYAEKGKKVRIQEGEGKTAVCAFFFPSAHRKQQEDLNTLFFK